MELAVFLLFALLALVSGLVVVAHRKPVYSVMSLVVTLVSLAVLFVMLGAPFLAALQVLVYAGAILVLFLFVLMLLSVEGEAPSSARPLQRWMALVSGAAFAFLLVLLFWRGYAGRSLGPLTEEAISLERLAEVLFSTYLLPFELVGLLLLAAVVAATMLAKKPPPPGKEEPR